MRRRKSNPRCKMKMKTVLISLIILGRKDQRNIQRRGIKT
jgi:hypothetical protein